MVFYDHEQTGVTFSYEESLTGDVTIMWKFTERTPEPELTCDSDDDDAPADGVEVQIPIEAIAEFARRVAFPDAFESGRQSAFDEMKSAIKKMRQNPLGGKAY